MKMKSKNNWTMRAAVLMFALVLITSSFVGGTFAKYVASGVASDEARVAKFGVKVNTTGDDLFKKEYSAADGTTTVTSGISVSSTEDVVAPGTSGSLTGLAVSGTPEVAVKVSYTADLELTNWQDSGNNYYCPLVITINGTSYKGVDYVSADAFETAVENAIQAHTQIYAPNQNLADTAIEDDYINVTWEWPFETTYTPAGGTAVTAELNDIKDTYLGDQAATATAAKVTLKLTATVTQID